MLLLAVVLLLLATFLATTALIWLAVSAARQPEYLSGLNLAWLKGQTRPVRLFGMSFFLGLLALALAWFR
ncbi:MAG: hypothetical protein ACOY81_01405 [Bacillota bacterium]|uniref:hypothetical protein n=1 Tax=Desulfurispora thermophila TaxID=265470 RepID=UPI00037C0EE4|nr:hypothetical protein [Desulfurispora thermophila]